MAVLAYIDLFQNSPKVTNLFGLLCKQMCRQELSKIAKSGHTGFEYCRRNCASCLLQVLQHVARSHSIETASVDYKKRKKQSHDRNICLSNKLSGSFYTM